MASAVARDARACVRSLRPQLLSLLLSPLSLAPRERVGTYYQRTPPLIFRFRGERALLPRRRYPARYREVKIPPGGDRPAAAAGAETRTEADTRLDLCARACVRVIHRSCRERIAGALPEEDAASGRAPLLSGPDCLESGRGSTCCSS